MTTNGHSHDPTAGWVIAFGPKNLIGRPHVEPPHKDVTLSPVYELITQAQQGPQGIQVQWQAIPPMFLTSLKALHVPAGYVVIDIDRDLGEAEGNAIRRAIQVAQAAFSGAPVRDNPQVAIAGPGDLAAMARALKGGPRRPG